MFVISVKISEKETGKLLFLHWCKKKSSIQPEYLLHRKTKHATLVSMCKNDVKGICKYGENNCWFIHDKNDNATFENKEVIQQLFNVMEKMTERISLLEQNNVK